MTEIAPAIYRPPWKRSGMRLGVLIGLLVVLIISAAVLWPGFAASQAASYLISAKKTTDLQICEIDLKLSLWLTPSSEANIQLVKLYLSQNRESEAVTLFNRLGAGSDANRIRLLIDMENNRGNQINIDAAGLTKSSQDASDQLLIALAWLSIDNKEAAAATTALLKPSEALDSATRAAASKTGLGIALAATGLPKSAERVLLEQPAGFARDTTLGDISATRGGKVNLAKARDFYLSALVFKPDSVELRGKLVSLLDQLNDTAAASAQRQLISKLEAGRP